MHDFFPIKSKKSKIVVKATNAEGGSLIFPTRGIKFFLMEKNTLYKLLCTKALLHFDSPRSNFHIGC